MPCFLTHCACHFWSFSHSNCICCCHRRSRPYRKHSCVFSLYTHSLCVLVKRIVVKIANYIRFRCWLCLTFITSHFWSTNINRSMSFFGVLKFFFYISVGPKNLPYVCICVCVFFNNLTSKLTPKYVYHLVMFSIQFFFINRYHSNWRKNHNTFRASDIV